MFREGESIGEEGEGGDSTDGSTSEGREGFPRDGLDVSVEDEEGVVFVFVVERGFGSIPFRVLENHTKIGDEL